MLKGERFERSARKTVRKTAAPKPPTGDSLARSVGESVATNMFYEFLDPSSRGPSFVWPDSLARLVQRHVVAQLFLRAVDKRCLAAAQDSASRRLAELLASRASSAGGRGGAIARRRRAPVLPRGETKAFDRRARMP